MRPSTVIGLVAMLGPAAWSDGDAGKPPEMNDLAKRTMDAWHQKAYHLGRAGVHKVRFDMNVSMSEPKRDPEGNAVKAILAKTTTGHFAWDAADPKSTDCEYEDPGLALFLGYRGWNIPRFSAWFDPSPWTDPYFQGARLSGRREKDGPVLIDVTRPDAPDTKGVMVFNDDSLPTSLDQVTEAAGRASKTRVEFAWEKKGESFLLRTFLETADTYSRKVEMSYETIGTYSVPKRVKVTESFPGATKDQELSYELELANWKLNDDTK